MKVLGLEKSISDISATRLPYPLIPILGLGSRLCAPLFQAVCLYRFLFKRAFVSSHSKYALPFTKSQEVRSIFLHFYTFTPSLRKSGQWANVARTFCLRCAGIFAPIYNPWQKKPMRRYRQRCRQHSAKKGAVLKKQGNNMLRGVPR